MNHFELFELPVQFELDGSSLSSRYLALQKRFHPDNFAAASDAEQLAAVQKAAQINDAYQTLNAPLARAQYLIELQGIEVQLEQSLHDADFLIEQMQLREQLEAIAEREDQAQLFALSEQVDLLQQQFMARLASVLAAKQWQAGLLLVRKLKFVVKLQQEIERIEDKLF